MGPSLLMLPSACGLLLLLLLLLPGRLMLSEWVVVVLSLGTRRPDGLIDWRTSWLPAISKGIKAALISAGAAWMEAGVWESKMIQAGRLRAGKHVRATVRRPSATVVLRAGCIEGTIRMLLGSASSQGAEESNILRNSITKENEKVDIGHPRLTITQAWGPLLCGVNSGT